MNDKKINLSYLMINFSALLNCNEAVSVECNNDGDEIPFEEWCKGVEEATGSRYLDLKACGINVLTICYESGVKLTFTF